MSEELEADNADELIEAMKEGFAVRLADVEAKAERYRLALMECQRTMDSEAEMVLRNLRRIITEALK